MNRDERADHSIYVEANRRHWNEIVAIHLASDLYDVPAFRQGRRGLHALERDELGDVSGKTLLHLQCHFGLDTLSWARLGAEVTGVDLSDEAIAQARALAGEVGVPARFIISDVYALPDLLDETFDVVFTSYGAINWLPDLSRWGAVAGGFLKPGGTFYVAEFHPTGYLFDDAATDGFRVRYPYFHSPEPLRDDEDGDYAQPDATLANRTTYAWAHGIGDVVNAILDAGMRIEHLHEFGYSTFRQFPFLERREDGFWHPPAGMEPMPLLFSIKATKE